MSKNKNRNRISAHTKIAVLNRHDWKCVNCGTTEELELHHVVPLEIGGNDIAENIVPLCYYCHKAVTDHELLLRTAGRKHTAGGRKRTIPDNYKEILDRYVRCEYGVKDCKKLLGLSQHNHFQDNPWWKEYLKEKGIACCKNVIDLKMSKNGVKKGDAVGKIMYVNKTEEICYAQHDIVSKAEQISFNFNAGSSSRKSDEYKVNIN